MTMILTARSHPIRRSATHAGLLSLSLAIAAGLALGGPDAASAQGASYRLARAENEVRIHAGLFTPRGDGEYWRDKERDFTGDINDFEDASFGFEYARTVLPLLDLLISAGTFGTELDQHYRDFVDTNDREIWHTTRLETAHLTAGVRLRLAPGRSPVVPYLAAGGGFYTYTLEEAGEFIDFNPPPPTIFADVFVEEGEAFGWFVAAGLEANFAQQFGVFAEARWHRVEDDLGGDFEDFGTLDLSGRDIRGGIIWRF